MLRVTHSLRHYLHAATVVCALAVAAPAAQSQPSPPPPCGDAVSVVRGDTLSRIARRCDVTEATLLAANPRVSGSGDLQVGARLSVRPDDAAGRLSGLASRTGEALGGIAGEVGSSVGGLLDRNPAVRDRLRQLGLPSGDGHTDRPTLAAFPARGGPGTPVALSAINLPANASVAIGAGSRGEAYEVLDRARTAADGTLDATVRVPAWAAGAGSLTGPLTGPLVFVVADGEGQVQVRSDPFAVTGAPASPSRP